MKNLSGILSAICLLPTASHAADTAFGDLEPYGEVAIHRLSDSNFNQHYWSGDFGVRLNPKDDAKPMNFGFYVGYEGLGFFENLDDIESTSDIGYPTAAAVVRSGAHQFSVNGRVKVSQRAAQNVATLGLARSPGERALASGRPRFS
jgi:hypothetical protein